MQERDTILLSDLDGTLLSSKGCVSEQNRDAIAAYIQRGGMFGISTGRGAWNARALLPGLPINAPSIVLNGAGIYDYQAGAFLYARHADKRVLLPLVAWCLKHTPLVDIQVYTEEEIYYVSDPSTVNGPFLALHEPYCFGEISDLSEMPIFKCLCFGPTADLQRIEAYASASPELSGGFYCVHSSTDIIGRVEYIEFMPKGINKGIAVTELKKQYPQRKVIAIGDYWNDLEMLQNADVSVAPSNALPEIKGICSCEVADNDHHAIAEIVLGVLKEL